MRKPLLFSLTVAIFVVGLTAAVALAGNGKGGRCVKIHHVRFCRPKLGTTTINRTTTASTTTAPTTSTSPTTTSTTPAPPSHESAVPWCVQTVQYGETYIQANAGSFLPGGDWYDLWRNEATVVVAGRTITLQYENGKGAQLAPLVPGVGSTCDQPYMSTDGVPYYTPTGEPIVYATPA